MGSDRPGMRDGGLAGWLRLGLLGSRPLVARSARDGRMSRERDPQAAPSQPDGNDFTPPTSAAS